MEIKVGSRALQIPESCPKDAPRKATLKRHLREHGPEAFMLSRKLSPFAGCIAEDLRKAAAENNKS